MVVIDEGEMSRAWKLTDPCPCDLSFCFALTAGNLTNGEDIGDSGLRFAYQAWQNQLNASPATDFVLPGLDFTKEQLFFVGFGS